MREQRDGPNVIVRYDCLGCKHLRAFQDEVDHEYYCQEPSISEQVAKDWSIQKIKDTKPKQYIGSMSGTPEWCPYIPEWKRKLETT